jgi:ABC-2 type transport system permease protein
MIRRVARLTAAEFLKLGAHPFLYLALGVLGAATLLSGIFYPAVFQKQETVWRAFHAVQLFGYGFQFGLKLATYVLVVFSSMIVAGEFDRGTVKNLLTRPVTRTDVFAAKALTVLVLGLGLFAYVLYLSLAWGLWRGNLGPVWDDATYVVMLSGPRIAADARQAVLMCLPAFLAAGFLGLLVSAWTESSGYAVAVALVLFIAGDVVTELLRGASQRALFFHYGSYSLARLKELAEGKSAAFARDVTAGGFPLWASVPSAYVAVFLPAAYARFRSRNITA